LGTSDFKNFKILKKERRRGYGGPGGDVSGMEYVQELADYRI
jgi:hypothetical protein